MGKTDIKLNYISYQQEYHKNLHFNKDNASSLTFKILPITHQWLIIGGILYGIPFHF